MGAIFYNYSGNSMLKGSVGPMATPISTNLFSSLVTAKSLCILTQISVTTNDIIQFFTTFDNFIHYYYFGQGVGQISISGMLFMDCTGNFPGLSTFYNTIAEARGQAITVSTGSGGVTFTGVLLDCNVTFISEPETVANFTANFGMINSRLVSPTFKSGCS